MKQEIEEIKAKSKDPRLDNDSKLAKLVELQFVMGRVKALKESVEHGKDVSMRSGASLRSELMS